jgi:hypothetical protein
MEEVKDQLDSELRDLGFKPGDYQAEWRDFGVDQEIEFDTDLATKAVLDALINQGGIQAWSGAGVSCVVQMLQYAYKQRDKWRTLAKQNAEKAWMLYDDLNE